MKELMLSFLATHLNNYSAIMSGPGGAVDRACVSDTVVGGCELESRHCHWTCTGSTHATSTNAALDNAGTGLITFVP